MKQAHVWADVYKRRLFSMMEIVLRLSLSLFIKNFIIFTIPFREYDIMSVSEREQAMLVHRERRMAIMIAAYAASSTKGANHDIMSVREREQAMLVHRERRMAS